jgi:hypothetical protein
MNDFSNIPLVTQPKNLNITLYQHQLASIYKMEKLEIDNLIEISSNKFKKTKIGINADITGHGKTLSMIGLIIRDKMEWDKYKPFVIEKIKIEAEGLVKSYEILRYNKIPTTLILVSQSILKQWIEEIKKSNLTYISIITKQDLTELQAEDYDIVLVIPSMYNKLITVYSNCAWKRFIFDEPGNLKVSGMAEIKAGFYWFVTATPYQIFHHHYRCNKGSFMRDLIGQSYSEFELLLNDITINNHPEFVKASFDMPKTFHKYHKCYQPIFNVIRSFVSDNVKNMIESGNIEGAIISLGGQRTDNIVDLIIQKKRKEIIELDLRKQIYELKHSQNEQEIDNKIDNKILEIDNKKIQLQLQIDALDDKFKEMLQTPCNICCEKLKNPVLEINCQNVFCGECLLTWLRLKNACPLCRSEIDPKSLIYIKTLDDENIKLEKKEEKCMTKLEKIIDIINTNKNGKYLIFSDHDGSFISISKALKDHNISCIQIRGNIKTTEKNLNDFKSGDVNVIFLNSKYFGAGINLQEATDIILYHEMNFDTETQIIGRANRIGRLKTLNVHHLQIKF